MKNLLFVKNRILFFLSLTAIFLISGCGINSGLLNQFNVNGANTNVILQKNNFKVIGTVNGTASDSYILIFGGSKKNLVAKAKQNMIDNAKLEGTSKAIINVTLEENGLVFIFFNKRTITVHGTVIEFTD